jgi:hypothetical protein
MATKVMKYTSDLGIVWGVNVDDTAQSIMGILDDDGGSFDDASTGQKVFLYDDFEAFQTANPGCEMIPSTITARRISLAHPMGTRDLVAPTPFNATELGILEGTTGLGANAISVSRLQGEVDNTPDIDAPV